MNTKFFVRRNGEAVLFGNYDECSKYVAGKESWWGNSQAKPVYTIEADTERYSRAWDEDGSFCDY